MSPTKVTDTDKYYKIKEDAEEYRLQQKEFKHKLIEYVKPQRSLWDRFDSGWNNKNRYAIWVQIAERLSRETGRQMGARLCSTTWKNLVDQTRSYRKQLVARKNTGEFFTGDTTWEFWEPMHFIAEMFDKLDWEKRCRHENNDTESLLNGSAVESGSLVGDSNSDDGTVEMFPGDVSTTEAIIRYINDSVKKEDVEETDEKPQEPPSTTDNLTVDACITVNPSISDKEVEPWRRRGPAPKKSRHYSPTEQALLMKCYLDSTSRGGRASLDDSSSPTPPFFPAPPIELPPPTPLNPTVQLINAKFNTFNERNSKFAAEFEMALLEKVTEFSRKFLELDDKDKC